MARFNEIQVGRVGRSLQKLFGMKGGNPVPSLAGELYPVHPMFSGVENRYLEAWEKFGSATLTAAVGAATSGVRLRNPSGSNIVIVVEKLTFDLDAIDGGVEFDHGPIGTDLGAFAVPTRFDARSATRGATAIYSTGTNPAIGTMAVKGLFGTSAAAATYDVVSDALHEIPIFPGDAAQIRTSIVNVNLRSTWWWRERFLEDAERT